MDGLSSVLDAVTVYATGALCTRKASVQPTQVVDRKVRLTGLPLSLLSGSMRAKVVGGEKVKAIDVRADFEVSQLAAADLPVAQRDVDQAGQLLNRLEQERQRVDERINQLSQLRPSYLPQKKGVAPREAPVEATLELGAFIADELAPLLKRRQALWVELADARHQLELCQKRLEEASTALKTQQVQVSRSAVVTLSEAPAGPIELSLEYQVPGARWTPSYDLRLAKDLIQGALTMRASVVQHTGEDWSQVKLSLSTAALDRRTDLPELKALKIGRSQPQPPRSGWREPPQGLDELFESFDAATRGRPAPPSPVMVARPQPLPPPPPMAQSAPMPAGPGGVEQQKKKRGGSTLTGGGAREEMAELAPPRNAPRAPPAPTMVMAAPMGAPLAKKSAGLFGAVGGAVATLSRSRAAAPADEYEDGGAPETAAYDEDEVTGSYAAAAMPEPAAIAPERGLLEYDRLTMPAPEGHGSRGRLRPMSEVELFMLTHVRVQVDVISAVMVRSEQTARNAFDAGLPHYACDVRDSAGSYDYRYDCAARVDVPSTGKLTLVPVMVTQARFTPGYTTVPSVEPKVYRVLSISNSGPHALLRGPVDVSVGEEFLLTAQLPNVAPGGEAARLGLGVEEAIKVARKTQFKETSGGLLGGSTVLPHEIEIELNNRLPFPVPVEVRERVPTSTDETIKIEETARPQWEKDEKVRDGVQVDGARKWLVQVAAGQKTTLTAQFSIRIPADKMLVGGNRRV